MGDLELRAERVAAGGDAIAREPEGRVVFVPGALPGELVRVRLVASKRDFARAELIEVLEAAPERVTPPCPYVAAGCGGCRWQHVTPAAQRELKVAIVAEALRRTGGVPDAVVEAGPVLPTTGFRTTLRLATRGAHLGFRRFHGHDVVPVGDCLVAHPRLGELLGVAFPGVDEVTLRVSGATGERLAFPDPVAAARPSGLPADTGFGPDAAIHEAIGGARLRVSAGSFFQTRTDGAEALVAEVVRAAADGGAAALAGPVIDAYGGVGLFAAAAFADRTVVVIEQSSSSCGDARHNLAGRDATVVEGPVERWRLAGPRPAVVVADPSRAGLGRDGVDALAAAEAPVFVVVSCDPVALARDARLLAERGYRHVRSTVVDLFPHTPHVEAVSLFQYQFCERGHPAGRRGPY
jgi:tRNA/tmRNA/rRNA uracil-C5-methylase (TrmA/RlmC/RlmD family)